MPTAVNIKRTKVFANTAARVAATPDFVGQFGIQLDLTSLWRSTSLAAGAWSTNFKMDGLELDYANLTNQSPEPGTPDDGLRVYVANATMLAIKNTGGDTAYINTGGLSGNRVFVLPDASGTFALSSTGETFTSITINGTAGDGFVGLASQSPAPEEPSDGVRLYGTGVGWAFKDISAHVAAFDMADLLTSNRTYTLPDASGTILLSPVDLASQVTGTLPYANGGTNATTQSAARVNLGGGRWFSNLAAAAAATPDTIGQVSSAFEGVDGVIYSAYGTSAGQVFPWMTYDGSDDAITINKILSTNSKSFSSGRISSIATAAQGGEHQLSTTGAFVDGVLELWNGTGGYSAVAIFDPDAGAFAGGAAAFGYSPGSSGADYTDVPHIATNPAGGIGSGIPFGIWIEENISASGYLAHRRVWMDNSNVRIYGVTAASAVGPIGIDVASSGNVTLAPTSAGSAIIGGGATASTLRFLEPSGSGTNYSEFKAQAQSANITYTFPATIPTANDVLTASSVSAPNVTLSWTTPSGGSGTKTKAFFNPLNNQPPAANFATIDTRNSIALLNFDDTTEESAIFVGVMPEGASLGSGLSVFVTCCAATATSGDYRLGAAWMRCNTDIDSDSFDTAVEATTTTSGTSGIPSKTTLTTTNIDGITAGDMYRLKIYRDTSDGGDTMAGDLQLLTVEVQTVA